MPSGRYSRRARKNALEMKALGESIGERRGVMKGYKNGEAVGYAKGLKDGFNKLVSWFRDSSIWKRVKYIFKPSAIIDEK